MKMPMDYKERAKIVDRICGSAEPQLFDFSEILEWKQNNMLEHGDLFAMEKDGDYYFFVVYLDNKWYIITDDPKLVEISEDVLDKYKYFNKNLIENPYQRFLNRDGLEEFNKLSFEDKCDVYAGNYYTKHVNSILDGLKDALSDVIDALKETK